VCEKCALAFLGVMTLEASKEYISTTYASELMILSSRLTCHNLSQLVAKDRGICGLAYKY